MINIYGIDVAEKLNYFVCWVLGVQQNEVRIRTVKIAKDILYPELERLIIKTMIPKYPPKEIWVDYTNEKSFSEWLESKLNPAFANPYSKQHGKWKYVEPVVFSQPVKLNMKQNARQMMEEDPVTKKRIFTFPDPKKTRPETNAIIDLAREQLLREGFKIGGGGGVPRMHFPKPDGFDNDLVMGLELGLLGCRKYVPHFTNIGKPFIQGTRLENIMRKPDPADKFIRNVSERMRQFNVTGYDIKL